MENRYTNILVDADVEMMFHGGEFSALIRICNIPCVWVWDESSREAAEYWAALDHVSNHYKFDWMTIKSWTGSPVKSIVDTHSENNVG